MVVTHGLILLLMIPQFFSSRVVEIGGNDENIDNALIKTAETRSPTCNGDDSLILSNLNYTEIPIDLIRNGTIRQINLEGNKIRDISADKFNGVPNLECLNLASNEITLSQVLSLKNMSARTLVLDDLSVPIKDKLGNEGGYFPNVENLSLNKINRFAVTTSFKDMFPRLDRLFLMQIPNIQAAFDFVTEYLPGTLRHLHLQNSGLDSLNLYSVGNLQSLYLDGNNLRDGFRIAGDANNLQVVSLRRCGFTANYIKVFFPYSRHALTFLDLSENLMDYLPINMLERAINLETLGLSKNEFTQIPDLKRQSRLRILLLSYNNISLPSQMADLLPTSLRILSLRGNNITSIGEKTFEKLTELEELDLSENKLALLPPTWTHDLKNLKRLLLNSNMFKHFADISLTPALSNLQNVYVARNTMTEISEREWSTIPENTTVHM
ncbi:lumican [Megalopta genalis]|uniref:lumican n=1 Tax=Megalopta genalis TaxID=115081 RepID=UPI0014438614|nr:adenylate cyclase-like [Megalopta genalis]